MPSERDECELRPTPEMVSAVGKVLENGSFVEGIDNLADTTRELIKNGKYLLVSVPEGGFIESYINGDQGIVLRHREVVVGSEPCQDGLVIYKADSLGSPNGHAALAHNQNPNRGNAGSNEPFMLPHDVEVMEGPYCVIPSFVRFERFDRGAVGSGKPLFSFCTIYPAQRIDHVEVGIENWEVPIAGRFFAVAYRERGCKQVEAAAERVDNSADPSVESERHWGSEASYHQNLARLRIALFDNVIWAAFLPPSEFLSEQFDLGYGPLNGRPSV